jgi:hypothetical protein
MSHKLIKPLRLGTWPWRTQQLMQMLIPCLVYLRFSVLIRRMPLAVSLTYFSRQCPAYRYRIYDERAHHTQQLLRPQLV